MKNQRISLLNILCENGKFYLFTYLKSQSTEELKVLAKEFYEKREINKFKDNDEIIANILKKMDYLLNLGHVFGNGKTSSLSIEYK